MRFAKSLLVAGALALSAGTAFAAEGVKICLELMTELAGIPGVAGVHLMAPGNEAAIADVLKAAGGMKRRA